MSQKTQLQQIAKNKILKNQVKTVRKDKSRTEQIKQRTVGKRVQIAAYFPAIPSGQFSYNRPAESSEKSKQIAELAASFKGKFHQNIYSQKIQNKKRLRAKLIEQQYQQIFGKQQ